MIKVAIVSLSGGQGKTTLATILGRSLAAQGFRALMIDLDPLHDLTHWLAFEWQASQKTLIDVFQSGESMLNILYPLPSEEENFWLIPAQESLRQVEEERFKTIRTARLSLQQCLAPLESDLDICIFDAPPQSLMLNEIALKSADCILIPAEASVKGYSSLIHTLNLISEVFRSNDFSALLGVVPFRDRWIGSKRSQESRVAIESMAEEVGENKILPSIRESEVFKRAINLHTTPAGLGEPALEEGIHVLIQHLITDYHLTARARAPRSTSKKAAKASKSSQTNPSKRRKTSS